MTDTPDHEPADAGPRVPSRPLRYGVELPVLGVPVRFEADDRAAAEAAAVVYGGWGDVLGRRAPVSDPPVRPRIVLMVPRQGADAGVPADPPRVETVDGGHLRVEGAGVSARADARRLAAAVRLSPALLADRERLREALDAPVLFLVTRLDRQPVHAAAVAAGGRALVLAGPSGVGKSTLAYAAHRAGLSVLSDDAVYVQLEPRLRVWGPMRRLHLVPDAAARYAELAGERPVLRPTGKRKIAVDPGPATDPPVAERVGLCLLERGAGPVALASIHADEAVAGLLERLDPGFDLFRDTVEPALRALAGGGAWRLRLSSDPDAAVPVLRELLVRVRG